MTLRKLFLRGTIIVSAIALLMGVKSANAQALNVAGSTFVYPIMNKWIQRYHELHPGVSINYQAIGSGAGIAQYKSGTVDFGASDVPLDNKELATMPRPTLNILDVSGAIVLCYNVRGIGPGLHLSGPVIADIYLGRITKWNDPRIEKLNPYLHLPAEPIRVMHRSDASGTSYIFTSYLASVSKAWKDGPGVGKSPNWPVGIGAQGNPGVAGLIRHAEGSFGYIELAYALQNHMPAAVVENRSGNFVAASIQTTAFAVNSAVKRMEKDIRVSIVNGPGVNTYPICGFSYLIVPKFPANAAHGKAMVDFLKWTMTDEAQRMAADLLYAPLPESIRKINLKIIDTIKVR
jgi:phosphate transport system substrate-binding protein